MMASARDPWASNYLSTYVVSGEDYARARWHLGALYFIRDDDTGRMKIGYSDDPIRRRTQLQVGSAGRLRIVAMIAAEPEIERRVHGMLDEWRERGEWFDDRGKDVTNWIERMTNGEPIARQVWRMTPGVSEVVEDGYWTRIYARPDPTYVAQGALRGIEG